jgi:hypothetical protein
MTNQHPLTDSFLQSYYKYGDGPYDEDQMRAAYDLAVNQMIGWLEDNLGSSMYLQLTENGGTEVNVGYVIQHLREEMRPL